MLHWCGAVLSFTDQNICHPCFATLICSNMAVSPFFYIDFRVSLAQLGDIDYIISSKGIRRLSNITTVIN